MVFSLADFKHQQLKEIDEEVKNAFSLDDYADKNAFKSRVRLYFTTEKKEGLDISSDDDDWPIPWPTNPTGAEKNDEDIGEQEISTTSVLIGTTQDEAYMESLAVDSKKDYERRQLLEQEVQNVTRQEKVWSERAQRVQAEPNNDNEHVIVLVCHLIFGTVSRMFPTNSTMNQVYDWIGSLNLLPEYFRLIYPVSGEILLPEMVVKECANCVLNMSQCEEPISLVHDDTKISAIGFAENVPDLSIKSVIPEIPESLPDQFMEEDGNVTVAVSTM
jgi:hypothetical protein